MISSFKNLVCLVWLAIRYFVFLFIFLFIFIPDCVNYDGKKAVTIENEDLVATEECVNIIDPIGKKVMTEPVRNKVCGHVYEKSTVLQMIKQSRRKGFK